MKGRKQWLSIVALLATTAAVLLTRAECSGGHPVGECVRAVMAAVVSPSTGVVGIDP